MLNGIPSGSGASPSICIMASLCFIYQGTWTVFGVLLFFIGSSSR
jgi:hypothetical protein